MYRFSVAEQANAGAYSMMSVLCDKAIVKKEELWEVVGTDRWQINNLLDDEYEPRPAHVILREAKTLLNQELPYCVFRGNCEHFATELRYGKAQSRQVSRKTGNYALICKQISCYCSPKFAQCKAKMSCVSQLS